MDRITKVWFKNLRTLADVTLDLDGLTVLVGENGTGKSTILEGLRLLSRCIEREFTAQISQLHGSGRNLVRSGESVLTLGLNSTGATADLPPLRYEVVLEYQAAFGSLLKRQEVVDLYDATSDRWFPVVEQRGSKARAFDRSRSTWTDIDVYNPHESLLSFFSNQPECSPSRRIAGALGRIQVHVPFEVDAYWSSTEGGAAALTRVSTQLQSVHRVGIRGRDLASVYQHLKNNLGAPHWAQTMELVQLGLGDDVDDVGVRADPGGQIALQLKYRQHVLPIPSSSLSAGTLAWLAFVALYRTTKPGDLVAFDEPELHLHPGLVCNVVNLFESMARNGPVVLATHSDRVLDFLQAPDESIVVCELDRERRTRLRRPDPQALATWMDSYSGYGSIRTAGHEASVLREPDP